MAEITEHWKCNRCGTTEEVVNGICPNCGPTQTTPLSNEAKKEAGVAEAAAEREAKAQAEATATEQ